MKKKVFVGLFALVLCFLLSGCGSTKEFTISCTPEKNMYDGMENQTVITYSFNKDQFATEYTAVTTQTFYDESTYQTYKTAQEATVNNNGETTVEYDLKTDDDNLSIVFTMTLKNLIDNAKTDEDKAALKASVILNNNENSNIPCILNDISRDELK